MRIRKFLGVPVRKSQNRKFLSLICKSQIREVPQNTSQLCLKPAPKVVLLKLFFILYKF